MTTPMDITGKVAFITGAGQGIGRAVARAVAARGAGCVVVVDRNGQAAESVATELGGIGLQCDVADATALGQAVATAEERLGRIDILVSNAGFGSGRLNLDDALAVPDELWTRMWEVHVMAHVHACRAALPGMLARGSGALINVASAAGLLSQVGDTPYSVTKHAAVGLAESLAITYGDRGIDVSVVCPQYVATAIVGMDEQGGPGTVPGVISVEQAASAIVDGIVARRFMILTHPEVLGYLQRKVEDPDRWLIGMRRLREGLRAGDFPKGRK
jgi:NAD(P)-dependent dehydrogenase (short-subunit alcohol dehydrogenase family)